MSIKSILKTLCILTIIVSICLGFCNTVLAIDTSFYEPDIQEEQDELNEKTGKILGLISVIGTIVSVAVIMIMGIKYMAGSLEEKAEYKKTMLTYLIGAILLFGATVLPNIIYNIMIPGESSNTGGTNDGGPVKIPSKVDMLK